VGLFRKKRGDGFIDLGDGQVAVSPEKVDEMADQAVQKVLETYEEEIPQGCLDALELAVARRHGSDPGYELGGLLISHARMGYGARQFEDSMETTEAVVPWLTSEIERRLNADIDETGDLVSIFADIAVDLCDYRRDDPSAPRSIDAIGSPLAPLRDKICIKFATATANAAAGRGMCEPGELPEDVDGAELLAIWRVGFLIRACETSLPSRWTDPNTTLIVVDSEAAREAAHEWGRDHPDASQQETDEATKRIMLDPRFRIDVDDERVGRDPRFLMFELDQDGEIIPQPHSDESDAGGTTLEELERRYGVD
jgi:hypothetical protein